MARRPTGRSLRSQRVRLSTERRPALAGRDPRRDPGHVWWAGGILPIRQSGGEHPVCRSSSGLGTLATMRPDWRTWHWVLTLVLASGAACDDDDGPVFCNGDRCVCAEGADCVLQCHAPPCKLTCAANNPRCVGDCANGDCECGPGSHCEFDCAASPCHVTCRGSTSCSGVCANGTCECLDATCDFDCDAGPCHVDCGPDTACSGVCANGTCSCGAGSQCLFRCLDNLCQYECADGSPLECPDGITISCGGAPCP